MESFTLLKYWRAAPVGAGRPPNIIAAADNEDEDDDDDASFFDIEFSPDARPVSPDPSSAAALMQPNSDEVVTKHVVHFAPRAGELKPPTQEPQSVVVAAGAASSSGEKQVQLPVASLLKSATKFRVFLLGLRKPKASLPEFTAAVGSAAASPKPQRKLLIKLRVDESAPFVSLFSRDASNSSRISAASNTPSDSAATAPSPQDSSEERRFAKEAVLRYLNIIQPLYVRVSRRYGERLRFSGHVSSETDADGDETDAEVEPGTGADAVAGGVVACGVRPPRASMPAGWRQVCKRLGKSRSASAAVAAAPAAPTPPRRDDSLLQLQDGIQSAIAHCKRSFNSSSKGGSESPLFRSNSDPGEGRGDSDRAMLDEGKSGA